MPAPEVHKLVSTCRIFVIIECLFVPLQIHVKMLVFDSLHICLISTILLNGLVKPTKVLLYDSPYIYLASAVCSIA